MSACRITSDAGLGAWQAEVGGRAQPMGNAVETGQSGLIRQPRRSMASGGTRPFQARWQMSAKLRDNAVKCAAPLARGTVRLS